MGPERNPTVNMSNEQNPTNDPTYKYYEVDLGYSPQVGRNHDSSIKGITGLDNDLNDLLGIEVMSAALGFGLRDRQYMGCREEFDLRTMVTAIHTKVLQHGYELEYLTINILEPKMVVFQASDNYRNENGCDPDFIA